MSAPGPPPRHDGGVDTRPATAEESFSSRLERWLASTEPKTLGTLGEAFGEQSFAVAILLLMLLPALPLPTGGVSHVFEAIAVVLAAEMIAGRDTIWLPERWHDRPLGSLTTDSAIPRIAALVRRVERFSKPRASWLFHLRWTSRVLGIALMAFAIAAALAPPFSGLDTFPALGAVGVCLAIIMEDALVLLIGLIIGTGGIVLIITVGTALARLLGRLV